MSTNNHPSLGVIGIPFQKFGENIIYSPEILFGSVNDQKAYKFSGNNKFE